MSIQYFKTSAQSAFTGVAVTVGPVEWIMPFVGKNDRVLFRQRFQQDVGSWTAAALNTAHPSATTFLLVREDDFTNVNGGQHQWYRYYACTPPARTEYTSYAAQFPGYQTTTATDGRDPIAATVAAKITTDYFLVGSVPTLARADVVTYSGGNVAPLLSNIYLRPLTGSTPSISGYLALMSTDAATAASFSVTAEPQTLERWEGNFYARRTVNVKAV